MVGIFRKTIILLIARFWHFSIVNKMGKTIRHQPSGLNIGRIDLGFVLLTQKSRHGHTGQHTNNDHNNQQLHQGEAGGQGTPLALLAPWLWQKAWVTQVRPGVGVVVWDGDGDRCWRVDMWRPPSGSGLPEPA